MDDAVENISEKKRKGRGKRKKQREREQWQMKQASAFKHQRLPLFRVYLMPKAFVIFVWLESYPSLPKREMALIFYLFSAGFQLYTVIQYLFDQQRLTRNACSVNKACKLLYKWITNVRAPYVTWISGWTAATAQGKAPSLAISQLPPDSSRQCCERGV